MALVELECAVYGEGSVFPVRIALDAKVSALQKAIAAVVSTEQYTVAPRLVALYLAKTERGWVKSDAGLEAFLKQGRQDTTAHPCPFVKMIPNWKLNKIEYFGTDFGPGDDDIHVFVELPAPTAPDASRYFITPAVQGQVKKAVFLVVADDDDHEAVGMGVFFTPTLAVTCDHNLTVEHVVGSVVPLALGDGMLNCIVVLRDAERDFAILQSPTPRPFLPSWSGNTSDLVGRSDLVLASFRLGINEFHEGFTNRLGFAPAASICLSAHETFIMYSCSTYAGDSGAALILKEGCLVGIHRDTVNALSEDMERKRVIGERMNAVEQSLDNIVRSGLAQGCTGLLIRQVTRAVDEMLSLPV